MLALLLNPAPSWLKEPSLHDKLNLASAFADKMLRQLSDIVAEERYEQRWRLPFGDRNWEKSTVTRVLVSDYLILTPEGARRPYGYRDVFEVDGEPVRDREERLVALFLRPSRSSDSQIRRILAESARYTLGNLRRNIDTPTLALWFLSGDYRLRFKFSDAIDAEPSLEFDELDLPPNVWVLAYVESWPISIIRGPNRKNLTARGRFWIEPETGRILVSEMIVGEATWDLVITVRYDQDERRGHVVPVAMRERFANEASDSHVEGLATYTNVRQFQVDVQETVPLR